jgi:hypothetical protein
VQRLADAEPEIAASAALSPSPSPSVVKRTVTETEPIKFSTRRVKDIDLPKGEKEKRTAGVNGERTKTYAVTVVDGRETSRKLVKSEVTRKPTTEVVAVGTYTEPEEDKRWLCSRVRPVRAGGQRCGLCGRQRQRTRVAERQGEDDRRPPPACLGSSVRRRGRSRCA